MTRQHDLAAWLFVGVLLLGVGGCTQAQETMTTQKGTVACSVGGGGGQDPNAGSAGFSGQDGADASPCVGQPVEPVDGVTHRAVPARCLPRPDAGDNELPKTQLTDQCLKDSDCHTKPFGVCTNNQGNGGAAGNSCLYECETDSNCSGDQACFCPRAPSTGRGVCVPAGCKQDSDCGAGLLCAYLQTDCGEFQFLCQTPRDQCHTDDDCGGLGQCRWNGQFAACQPSCPVP